MSTSPTDPLPGPGEGAPPSEPRRAASITLAAAGAPRASDADLMDPAQRSLAEALRITFVLLQVGMIALVVLFLLSGARQVREAERGVRLTFGRVVEQDVPPGLHFSWPYPVGEFLTAPTGQDDIDLDAQFWPNIPAASRRMPLDDLTTLNLQGLVPGSDGSLITGDGNIVHAQWRAVFRRTDPAAYLRTVYQPQEQALLRAAVERAIVQTVAELPIDGLLRQVSTATPAEPPVTPAEQPAPAETGDAAQAASEEPQAPTAVAAGPETGVSARIRQLAQQTLDRLGTGIVVDEVVLKQFTPPLPVRQSFQQVQQSQSQAEKAREDAEKERRDALNRVAGLAAQPLLDRINAYERALGAADEAAATAVLAQIDALLEGTPVEIEGRRVEGLISGEATALISQARQERTEVVAAARSDVESFRAKLEQYRANPAVLINREWTQAFAEFLENETVQVMMMPPRAQVDLWLNQDPELLQAETIRRQARQVQETMLERERNRARQFQEDERRRRQEQERRNQR